MTIRARTISVLGTYLLVGGIAGVLVIHPLVLAILWLELSAEGVTSRPFVEFMQSRLWLVFVPRHLHMGLAFAALGGCLGVGFGLFTRAYVRRLRALQFLEQEIGRTIPEIIRGGGRRRPGGVQVQQRHSERIG